MDESPYPALLSHILDGGHFRPLIDGPDVLRHRAQWRTFIGELAACPPKDAEIAERFHTQWHVCHHYVRELVDDDYLLIDMLWAWLPRWRGTATTLYRGENIDRRESGRLGTGWTDKIDVARTFARGLNAMGKGGLVLRTNAPAEAIIAGPSKHSSEWLRENEYTVDIRKLAQVDEIERFGPNPLLTG
jgi:hypothetical protein